MGAPHSAGTTGGRLDDQPAEPSHPYYPPGIEIPNYAANTTPVWLLFFYFFAALGLVVAAALFLARRIQPQFARAARSQQALFVWFIVCGSIHCVFEGFFVLNHATLAESQAIPAQIWKEYALSDTRYLISDPFVLCIEGITALFYGPFSFVTAVAIVQNATNPASRSFLRHILQIIISVCQVYGLLLYYGTLSFEILYHGLSYCRPEFLYFWVYFVGTNAAWLVVPIYILYTSFLEVRNAFKAASLLEAGKLRLRSDYPDTHTTAPAVLAKRKKQ